MAFETPFSIEKALDKIVNKDYILPDIQRRFVWSRNQIERMFDSIMMGYPLGNLLLWEIEREKNYDLKFYQFMNEHYDGMNKENPTFDLKIAKENKLAVVDGQQRLTALYVGFKGSYYIKKGGANKDYQDRKNYTKYNLYVKLSEPTAEEKRNLDEETMNYRFEFLSERDPKENFIRASDFCNEGLQRSLYHDKDNQEHCDNRLYELLADKRHNKYALDFITKFQGKIKENSFVSYKQEKKSKKEEKSELDIVAEVFVRSNSGGTALTKSDILLSVATAHWKTKDLEHDNAREEIAEFIKKINKKGLNFDTDFIMKSCLVIAEVGDSTRLKIENFSNTNMKLISKKWKDIKKSIESAVDLAVDLGFAQSRRLTSSNIIIPIAYYLSKTNFSINKDDREKIRKWIVHAILKSTFRSSSDTMLKTAIDAIGKEPNNFNWVNLKAEFENANRSIRFSKDDIENILDDDSLAKAFSVLSVLYPNFILEKLIAGKYNFHDLEVDHVFPKTEFKDKKFIQFRDRIANLQFLTEYENNIIKQTNMPNNWCEGYVQKLKITESEWKKGNYMWNKEIPDISGFEEFYKDRRGRMKKKLMDILEVSQDEAKS